MNSQFRIDPSGPYHGAEEVNAAKQAAEQWWNVEGEPTQQFKSALSEYIGVKHVELVNSGSAANLAALMALTTNYIPEKRRIERGDEVITTALSFPTTVSPIVHAGCVPAFVDVERNTWNINPHQVLEMITPKTKAIMVAHALGNPFNVEAIQDICEDYGLTLIEDNADCLGAEVNKKRTGSFGHVSTVSFYPAHHVAVGEGGAVMTNNFQIFRGLQSMINWGRDCFTPESIVTTTRGCIPIKEVLPGDYVLTRKGYEKVNKVIVKIPQNKLLSIKAYGHKPIETTEDHKILVKRNKSWKWVRADKIVVGDILRGESIIPGYSGNTIDKDIMYLFGIYLAEGGLIKASKGPSGYNGKKYYYYATEINLCDDEEWVVKRLGSIVKKHFGVGYTVRKDKKHGLKMRIKSRKLYNILMDNFGTGSSKKFIGNRILMSVASMWSLLNGYFDGDGSTKGQGITLSSCNLGLISQVQSILNTFNIRAGYTMAKRKKKITINGKEVKNAKSLHTLNIYGVNRKRLENLLLGNGSVYLPYIEAPVEKISTLDYEGPLYDLSVENNHEYLVNGFIVHNCFCPPGQDDTCGARYGQKHGELPKGYDHKNTYTEFGFNMKMSQIQAAIGVEQMKRLPWFVDIRNYNHAFLRGVFEPYKEWFEFTEPYENTKMSPFGYVIKLSDKAPFSKQQFEWWLDKQGIKSRAFFCGNITKQPVLSKGNRFEYRSHPDLSVSDDVMENSFWIGVHPNIGEQERQYMQETITNFLDGFK